MIASIPTTLADLEADDTEARYQRQRKEQEDLNRVYGEAGFGVEGYAYMQNMLLANLAGAQNSPEFVEMGRRATLRGVMDDYAIDGLKKRNAERVAEAIKRLGGRWLLAATRLTP